MRSNRLLLSLCALLATACSSTTAGLTSQQWQDTGRPSNSPRVTGIIGVTEVTTLGLDLGGGPGSTSEDGEATMPLIAAQLQVPLRPGRLEFGYEAGFSLGWDSEREAFVIDTGTVLIKADNNAFLFDVSGGLYLATRLGQRVRIYGAAGPLFQYGSVDLDFDQQFNGRGSVSGSGVGLGYYARTGLDLQTGPGSAIGFVVRWVDSSVDLGGSLGNLDVEALQIGLAVTTGF